MTTVKYPVTLAIRALRAAEVSFENLEPLIFERADLQVAASQPCANVGVREDHASHASRGSLRPCWKRGSTRRKSVNFGV
jgi:hypothetical protein